MNVKVWLWMGALTGLVAGLVLEVWIDLPVRYMRLAQVAMVVFGAIVAAFVYEGARAVTLGEEPNHSTDHPRRRRVIRRVRRETRV